MAESIFGIHEAAFRVRSARAEVLANNLANADTPNFKARDIDFRKAISEAHRDSERFEMARTHNKHISSENFSSTEAFLKYRLPTQPALDGNTVETHIEKAQFMENSIQQTATLEFLNSKIKGIRGALKGE